MRSFKICAGLFLAGAVVLTAAADASAYIRLHIRPWWPMPVIVVPIAPPRVVVPPPPQPPGRPVGYVDTDVRPKDAQVFVDGVAQGVANAFDGAPSYLSLEPGRHRVEFRREGFEPAAVIVGVQPGEIVTIDLTLRERAQEPTGPVEGQTYQLETEGTGFLEIDVRPDDAAIYIDDAFYGTASQYREAGQKIMLRAGTHSVEIGRPGYVLYRGTIAVVPKESVRLSVTLEK